MTVPSHQRLARERNLPWYGRVPKGLKQNLEFRRKVRAWAAQSPRNAQTVWIMCARDILFWVNTFVYAYDPRSIGKGETITSPFITYEFQDELILSAQDAIFEKRDEVWVKSRDVGVSWILDMTFDHPYIFKPQMSFLLVSRIEDLVDKRGNPDCLMWKLDYIHAHLPEWMRPREERTKLHFRNLANGSTIDGTATSGEIGRGGRRTAIGMDEFAAFGVEQGYEALASSQKATNCRLFVSTPQGTGNAYADVAKSNITRREVGWEHHPIQNRGLYRSDNGKLELVDETFWKNPAACVRTVIEGVKRRFTVDDYPFILDGKLRSPYYDAECRRTPIPSIIAQELDRKFHGSDDPFVEADQINALVERFACPPLSLGTIEYDPSSCRPTRVVPAPRLLAQGSGMVSFWCPLDYAGRPRPSQYVVAVDVAAGTGRSDSVVVVADRTTGEKVALLKDPYIGTHKLAEVAVALCWLFADDGGNGAFLIWDAGGTAGATFRRRAFDELQYTYVYMRMVMDKITVERTERPGYSFSKLSKAPFLTEYARALFEGRYINHSKDGLLEFLEYKYTKDGKDVQHTKQASRMAGSGARDNHGDEVIADGLAWHAMQTFPVEQDTEVDEIPPSSFAARRQYRLKLEREAALDW